MGGNKVTGVSSIPVITHTTASPFLAYNQKHKGA
jgi:hypothetical protein